MRPIKGRVAADSGVRFGAIKDVYHSFGFPSEDAMRAAFNRGVLPAEALVRMGERRVAVDVEVLTELLRRRVAEPQA
jgi:hypothetical protein